MQTLTPKRIISLVPSQTELLYHLGLDKEVIGITKFCIHPDKWFKSKTRVGGTKTLDIQKIESLRPDLIIANKEENVKEQIEQLQHIAKVYVSYISNLEDALRMITTVGQLVNKDEKAKALVTEIQKRFDQFKTLNTQYSILNSDRNINLSTNQLSQPNQPNTAYLIWKDPYMAAGGDTFINDMMNHCGLKNVFAHIDRYPEITISQLSSSNCQLLLLSSEPYPFKQQHLNKIQDQLPDTKILLVDGQIFSWYGSRLLYATAYFGKLMSKYSVNSYI